MPSQANTTYEEEQSRTELPRGTLASRYIASGAYLMLAWPIFSFLSVTAARLLADGQESYAIPAFVIIVFLSLVLVSKPVSVLCSWLSSVLEQAVRREAIEATKFAAFIGIFAILLLRLELISATVLLAFAGPTLSALGLVAAAFGILHSRYEQSIDRNLSMISHYFRDSLLARLHQIPFWSLITIERPFLAFLATIAIVASIIVTVLIAVPMIFGVKFIDLNNLSESPINWLFVAELVWLWWIILPQVLLVFYCASTRLAEELRNRIPFLFCSGWFCIIFGVGERIAVVANAVELNSFFGFALLCSYLLPFGVIAAVILVDVLLITILSPIELWHVVLKRFGGRVSAIVGVVTFLLGIVLWAL